jgi:hypothetical protein
MRSRLRALQKISRPDTAEIPRRELLVPYTADEIAALERCARAQRTELRRMRLLGVIGLGAGAGCSSADMRYVYGTSIRRHPSGALIGKVAGPRPRTIVFLRRFETMVEEAAGFAGELSIATGPSGRPDAVARQQQRAAECNDAPRLQVARLQAFWRLQMLQAPVPLGVLLKVAGVKTARAFTDLVPQLPKSLVWAHLEALGDPAPQPEDAEGT